MSGKEHKYQRGKMVAWVVPAVASAAIFGILSLVQVVSFWGAIFAAIAFVVLGLILLRLI